MTKTFSIADWSRGKQSSEPDIVELTKAYLDRIDQLDGHLQAWETIDREGALAQAEQFAAEFRQGNLRGPLHGVPIGVKDIVDVKGLPTRAGSRLFTNRVASDDAPAVAQLRGAGAIVLGKTVTTELACFDPARTRNPHNAAHTPGGSSSGSAAAVAAGMCAAAIGSQTGGSIIRPASYCGVAGWKGAIGAVITQGVTPVSFTLDHLGPLANSAADLEVLAQVLEGRSAGKRLTALPKLVVVRGYFDEHLGDAERALFEESLALLRKAGAEIREILPPDSFGEVHSMHWRIMAVEAAMVYGDAFRHSPDDFGPKVASLLEEGLSISATDYAAALFHRQQFQRDLQQRWSAASVYVTPSTPTAAPKDVTTTGDPRFNSPWSYCGFPTATIPNGVTKAGLPTGLQLISLPQQASLCLQTAIWCENKLPPPVSPSS